MGAESERVKGFGKLEDGLRQASDWYLWALRERAPVGDGARGLQRGRGGLDLLSPTTMPGREHIAGARTVWPVSVTSSSGYAWAWRYGTAKTLS